MSCEYTIVPFILLSEPERNVAPSEPCRVCVHVVGVVGLECVSDFGAMQRLMPDRPKVRDQTKSDREL